MSPLVRERLAAYAHNAWSGWMIWLFSKSRYNEEDGTVTIPAELVSRWKRQMGASYSQLSVAEQESDRQEADRMIKIVVGYLTQTEEDVL